MDLVQKALTKTATVKVEETCLSWLQLSSIADPVTVDNQQEEDAPLITLSINDTCSISNKLLTQFILDPGSNTWSILRHGKAGLKPRLTRPVTLLLLATVRSQSLLEGPWTLLPRISLLHITY